MKNLLFGLLCLSHIPLLAQRLRGTCTVSGFVRNVENESLPNATVQIIPDKQIVNSNAYGFYSITVAPSDSINIKFSYIGYVSTTNKVPCQKDLRLDITLTDKANNLDEVTVSSSTAQPINSLIISPGQLKEIPLLLGEKDIVKGLQLMPGVQTGIDGSGALYVRGGNSDQNLVILDEAIVYNAYHAFGVFSVFNNDAIKGAELIKGGFSAQYGGRLSSVLNVQMNDGRRDGFHGKASIGLLSAKATIEGPVSYKKASYIVSGRRTYFDALAAPFFDDTFRIGYYFYDLNAKANYDLNRNNRLFVSAYLGQDHVGVNEKTFSSGINSTKIDYKFNIGWQSQTLTLRWNHVFSHRLFINTSGILSRYKFQLAQNQTNTPDRKSDPPYTNKLDYRSEINDAALKADINYYINAIHAIKAGAILTRHVILPNTITAVDTRTDTINTDNNQPVSCLETAAYLEDSYQPFSWLKVIYGLRLSGFFIGSSAYINPEPRLNLNYNIGHNTGLQFGYARMNQYVNLLSNSGVGFPTDMWVPATQRIAPQRTDLFTVGIATKLADDSWSFSIEGYYKTMRNLISLREGFSFLRLNKTTNGLNILYDSNDWQDKITQGRGTSYGIEVLAQKKTGKLTGWVGYTLSWTTYQFPAINNGLTFRPRQDRRHNLSITGVYHLTSTINFSANWVFGSGQPVTVPQNKFTAINHVPLFPIGYDISTVLAYPDRGTVLLPDYHRLDIGIQFIKKKSLHRSRTWELSAINVYNRKNPAFYYVNTADTSSTAGLNQLNRVVLIPFIPSVTYSLTF